MLRLGGTRFATRALGITAASAWLLAACERPRCVFRCTGADQCSLAGRQGACEPSGLCSFPDPACPSRRRYSALSGEHASGRCVEAARCGDGALQPGEECDDGKPIAGGGCTSRCVRCGPGEGDAWFAWNESGSCYTRHDRPLDWAAAARACAARGGHLAAFGSVYELAAAAASLLGSASAPYWIGLRYESIEGRFAWTTGEPVIPSVPRWQPGGLERRSGRGNCVTQRRPTGAPSVDESWQEEDCTRRLGYICERPPWIRDERSGHVYRLLYDSRTWSDASAGCRRLGGHLAAVSDPDEEAFLDATKVPPPYWIGGRRQGATFRWSTGEPFAHSAFASGEPDNFENRQDCLVTAEDARWHDRPCGEVYRALCEVD